LVKIMPNKFKTELKKFLYSRLPGLAGRYRYFGTEVHFMPGAFIFDIVAEEGIYEADLLRQIQLFLRPGGYYFDVGANVGFMSVPVIKTHPETHVVSFEPSPNSLPFLLRTHAGAADNQRWKIIGKAVGGEAGRASFSTSRGKFAGYDGLRHTHRQEEVKKIEVEVSTLDHEWYLLGKPQVTCIKMDIEGAEMDALAGASQLMESCRPAIFMEWYEDNFKCFGVQVTDLLTFARKYNYQLVATPQLFEIHTELHLRMFMATSGNIALIPLPLTAP